MSDAVLKTIQILEVEIEALDQRRGEMVKAIDSLRPLVGDAPALHRKARRGKPVRRSKKATKRGRTDGRTDGRSKVRASAAHGASLATRSRSLPDDAESTPHPRLELVPARDAAITRALRKGPAPTNALLEVLPDEPGQTAAQRESALANALTRLRLKKVIKQVEHGEWQLAG